MSFNKLRQQPAAAALATATKVAEPVKEAVVVKTPEPATTKAVALFGSTGGKSALMAVVEQAEQTNQELIYPIIQIAGGKAGGAFGPIKAVPQEIADQLPQGRKAIECVFMTYRFDLGAWAFGRGDPAAAEGNQAPVYSAAASANDAELGMLIEKAAKNYHYTPGGRDGDPGKKAIFNIDGTDDTAPGHPKARLSVLIYLPSVDDMCIVQTPGHYPSWVAAMVNLRKCAEADGTVPQFPCKLSVLSSVLPVNGYSVSTHALEITKKIDVEGKGWYDKYTAFLARIREDEALKTQLNNWCDGADRPITDEIRARLKRASTIKA